jgi:hypothetical protein
MNAPDVKLYNVNQVKDLFFPGRSTRWIRDTFTDGELGPVFRDEGGWLISETAIQKWRDNHSVKQVQAKPRANQLDNLKQNQL